MIFLFGTDGERNDCGKSVACRCNGCHEARDFNLVFEKFWFTLFFVRLFVCSQRWVLKCSVCKGERAVSGEELEAAKEVARRRRNDGHLQPARA